MFCNTRGKYVKWACRATIVGSFLGINSYAESLQEMEYYWQRQVIWYNVTDCFDIILTYGCSVVVYKNLKKIQDK